MRDYYGVELVMHRRRSIRTPLTLTTYAFGSVLLHYQDSLFFKVQYGNWVFFNEQKAPCPSLVTFSGKKNNEDAYTGFNMIFGERGYFFSFSFVVF